jgi:hypothetical protein
MHLYHHTQSFAVMGFTSLNALRHCALFHLGMGLFMLLTVAQWVILLLLALFHLIVVSWLIGRAMRVIPCVC